MTGKTHSSCGLLVGTLAIEHFEPDLFTSITMITLAVISSLFPDICHTHSKIGRRFKFVSFLIRLLFGHRTFTHSLLFICIITCLLYMIQTPYQYLLTIILGLLSHVILDMLTPKGVKLFYPIPISIKFPMTFKTGGLVDISLASALSIGAIYVLFQPYFNQLFTHWLSFMVVQSFIII